MAFSQPQFRSDFLPQIPRAKWDGWFVIGIFPPESEINFLKIQIYHAKFHKNEHSLASVEGMQDSEAVFMVGTKKKNFVHRMRFSSNDFSATQDPFSVTAGDFKIRLGTAEIKGNSVSCELGYSMNYRLPWLMLNKILTYVGYHGCMDAEVTLDGKKIKAKGLGILEHAFGWALKWVSPRAFLRGYWHWDVLSFWENDGAQFEDGIAALCFSPFGGKNLPLRGFGKFPREDSQNLSGLSVDYLEKKIGDGSQFPKRWRGTVKGKDGIFHYEATASAELISGIPGGGFMGFSYEGEYKKRGGASTPLSGSGFTEFAGLKL